MASQHSKQREQPGEEVRQALPTLKPVLHLVLPVAQVSYGGEDAHFITDVGGGAIGVADGVGGWQESGVNPAGAAQQATLPGCSWAVCRWNECCANSI